MGGGGLNSAEDGACALNCSHTGIENQEGVPYTFSVFFFFFDLFQAGTGFLRPDEFLRQCFAIVIVAHCFLSAFDSLKRKILIGFVSFTFCLPPSQVLKQPFLIVRLEIKLLR